MMKPSTILLADDHKLIRAEMRALLEMGGGVEVVGEAKNGREAVELVRKLRPAVVLMDISMPEMNGIEAAREILRAFPSIRVLMLSAYDDDAYVDRAIGLGASGYLLKQACSQDLMPAIREAEKGNTFFSPAISKRLGERRRKSPRHPVVPKQRKPLSAAARALAV